ncbi:MAG: aminotransferase class III-fold pyridoxal phosphate-dependent enzyme [Candidatus Nanopelagicales bacterium]
MTSTGVGPSSYFDPSRVGELDAVTADLVRRRIRALGPAYRLFYQEPVQLVRGAGVHLYDAEGTEYLDCYNNVPAVGHSHPRVSAAIAAQAAALNTHTRYLSEGIVHYAEDLLSTLPTELGHVMFTCTGSEAGDLALRIAKHQTGRTGVIVTRNAYHGVTTEVAAISPSLGGVDSVAPWVRVIDAPDAYHLDHLGAGFASLGDWFGAQVQGAAEDLAQHGTALAALVLDTIFASDGVLADPAGFLAPAVAAAHRAGALFIADEIQPGFGRTGHSLWGFTRHGVVPDIMTIGKPMGNGMPVAATIMRPELTESFGRDVRYFNTFGGNPVSIAAAQAVLDVVRDEHLQHNALVVGTQLRTQLRELKDPGIGQVRGAGLFLGVELVNPDGTPDETRTLTIINELRRQHILTATSGPHNNVLKIRPPLPFSTTDADRLVTELDAALTRHPR